jgi:hypothetical protein
MGRRIMSELEDAMTLSSFNPLFWETEAHRGNPRLLSNLVTNLKLLSGLLTPIPPKTDATVFTISDGGITGTWVWGLGDSRHVSNHVNETSTST